MKKNRYTEQQIISFLKEADAGVNVEELCRQHGIGHSTFYKWKAKYSGLEVSELKRLKALEAENQRLKAMYAKVSLEKEILQEALDGKL